MKYSEGFKRSIVRRLILPDAPSVSEISKETGVSIQTLYNWISSLKESIEMSDYQRTPEEWTLPEKHQAIMEYTALSPEEQGEWLRRQGLYSGHITLWKKEIQEALTGIHQPVTQQEQQEAKKQIKAFEKELNRKDKALAEMSALLVLKKKLAHLLEDEEQ